METQNTEWKESWRDEHLKCVCGFANALGGVIEIGKDDRGEVVGVADAATLLDELPKKIRSTMGIVVDVSLRKKGGLEYAVVKVKAYPNPISYRGKYYLRSGSTIQEATDSALDEMILRKYGRTWDSAPVPRIKPRDFYHDAFDVFRKKAIASERLTPEDVAGSDGKLLTALKLMDGDYMLKAALLLFHQDPERWCLGSYVKIGYFENDADLHYQDEIGGPLIGIADRIMDAIYTKYFKGLIRYEGIQRIDKFPMPREVLREAVLNAVIHKDYSTGNPIHIKSYDGKVVVYNDMRLPPNTTAQDILRGMGSKPHNPLIANAFFRSGQIEAWGRGIEKMRSGCVADGLPEPGFDINAGTFSICFQIREHGVDGGVNGGVNGGANGGANGGDGGINFGINGDNGGINEGNRGVNGDNGGINRGYGGINGDTIGNADFGINEIKDAIVRLMVENSEITAGQIANSLQTTKRRVEYYVHQLKKEGVVVRIGADKNGRWLVNLGASQG